MNIEQAEKIIPVQCWCEDCKEAFKPSLRKCPKCIIDPSRKPRIVTIFNAPKILMTVTEQTRTYDFSPAAWKSVQRALCGYVIFKCQRPGCQELVIRRPSSDGTLAVKNHFCSWSCNSRVTADAKKATGESLFCSCGCGQTIHITPYEKAHIKFHYVNQRHHYNHRMAQKRANRTPAQIKLMEYNRQHALRVRAKQKEKRVRGKDDEKVDLSLIYLECQGKCNKTVTDHKRVSGNKYACVNCGVKRDVKLYSVQNKELWDIKKATKAAELQVAA